MKISKYKKWLIAFGILLLLIGIGFTWYINNKDRLPRIMSRLKNPITENKPVEWEDGPTQRTNEKPNIIVVLVDDLGFNQISAYGNGLGNGKVKTPNIDQLAKEGALCTNGYSANAVCSPSRASLLTGRYATRFGFEFTPTPSGFMKNMAHSDNQSGPEVIYDAEAENNAPPMEEMGLPQSEVTLAELLKTQGYHNLMLGKWHLGGGSSYIPTSHGFDESLFLDGGLYLPVDHPDVVNAKLPFDPIDQYLWKNLNYAIKRNENQRMAPDGFLTDYLSNEACKAIEKNKNRPFFMYLAYWAVHTPCQALKSDYDQLSFISDHTERVQAAMVLAIDRGIGKLRASLKENGLDENTIIIFTSDNGSPNYLGLPNVNKPYRGWKLSFFEGGVHVPYIVHYPNKIPGGTIYNEPVSSIDIYSTCAAAANAVLPQDRIIDGVNLLPFLGQENSASPHDALYFKIGHNSIIIKDGWKLMQDELQGKYWLFNLNEDPTEKENLIDLEKKQATVLKRLLQEHISNQKAPLWPSVMKSPIFIDKHLNEKVTKSDEYMYWPN